MKPILETKPPFVIKIYDTFFHISADGLSDKDEDKFHYVKLKSIKLVKGKLNKTVANIENILSVFTDWSPIADEYESDEILIEFKTGEIETRYFNGVFSEKYKEAIELIKTKISNNV